jgi:enamine deaminase RidA (YjgF/YER057c/UK114 family)
MYVQSIQNYSNWLTKHQLQSQAIKAAGQVWLSGQIPADAQGNLIKGSIAEQTKAIIKNTGAILKASGTGLDRVVKVVVSNTYTMTMFGRRFTPAGIC